MYPDEDLDPMELSSGQNDFDASLWGGTNARYSFDNSADTSFSGMTLGL